MCWSGLSFSEVCYIVKHDKYRLSYLSCTFVVLQSRSASKVGWRQASRSVRRWGKLGSQFSDKPKPHKMWSISSALPLEFEENDKSWWKLMKVDESSEFLGPNFAWHCHIVVDADWSFWVWSSKFDGQALGIAWIWWRGNRLSWILVKIYVIGWIAGFIQ